MKISMTPNKIVKLIHASKGDTSLRKWAFEPYDNNGAISVSNIKDQLVYKTENGGTEQLLPVNTSTPTTSYFDGTINYGTDTDVEFIYKQSSYTGQARVKSIKGNTLCWNQLVQNGNFASTSGWETPASYATISVANNEISLTLTSVPSAWYQLRLLKTSATVFSVVQGHKYLALGSFYVPYGGNLNSIRLSLGANSQFEIIPTANTWNKIENIFTATMNSSDVWWVVNASTNYQVGDVVKYKNLMLIDLTAMFGSGNEPTIDQFKSLFPLNYYAYGQYLLNFNGTGIKTTGKNLINYINNRTSNGITFAYDPTTGGVSVSGTNTSTAYSDVGVGSADLTKYTIVYQGDYIASIQSDSNKIRIYVELKSLASGEVTTYPNIQTSQSFTVTEPCYMYTRIQAIAGTHDSVVYPMVRYDDTDSSFEPYTSSTLSLPISTYFTNGMKSAGTIYDELSDKAITRIGSVDLGSLNWNATSDENRFISADTKDIAKPAPLNTQVANMKSIVRCTSYADLTNKTGEGVALNSNTANYGMVCIRDTSVSSVEDLVTKYTGVYLNYELATYTETDIQNASLVCKNIEVPCYLSSGNLVCDATEELTNESGFFDAKLKLKDSSSVAYSSKFKLHVEDL